MRLKGKQKIMTERAQSTIEYFVLFILIVAGLVGMQVYVKRGMQGRLRGSLEQLTDEIAYSPGATNSSWVVTTNTQENSTYENKTSISSAMVNQSVQRNEEILSFAAEPARW